MLTDNAGVTVGLPVVTNASIMSTAGTTADVHVPDGAAVIASLSSKLIYCVDEQRDMQHGLFEDFAIWFEQLVATPDFVTSVDSWT